MAERPDGERIGARGVLAALAEDFTEFAAPSDGWPPGTARSSRETVPDGAGVPGIGAAGGGDGPLGWDGYGLASKRAADRTWAPLGAGADVVLAVRGAQVAFGGRRTRPVETVDDNAYTAEAQFDGGYVDELDDEGALSGLVLQGQKRS